MKGNFKKLIGVITILIGYVAVVVVFALFGADVDAKGITSTSTTCRSYKVKHKFDVQQGYPHGRKGYVVDHICALAQGGIDAPTNMQYQTLAESKVKDKIENTIVGKAVYCTSYNSTVVRKVFNCK